MTPTELLALSWARQCVASGEARRIREDRDLSRSLLAEAINVAPATVSRWESGTRVPTGAAGVRYARLLKRLDRTAVSA